MIDFYVEQHSGFALGNFINCTPTIMELYLKHHERIPVLFNTDYVAQCYINSPYIRPIKSADGLMRLFGSDLINKSNTCTDIDFIQDKILEYRVNHNPFIDQPNPFITDHDYGVFINGAGAENPEYLHRKLIPFEIQEIVKYNSTIPVYGTGSINDRNRNIFDGYYGNIRESLSLINGAKWIITNATGFYHAAGAMNKDQLALWKNCLRPRNENMNKNAIISSKHDWSINIINFLNQQSNAK